ncbi:TPA: hypothetical protein HA265_04310 [Candidatus Woesearchaeota archaeon]|nr:hypothetical protein [Candidatus Woesearchaeota archaeon]
MDSFDGFKAQAIRSLRVADYMLNITYPSVKEPKLLLAIIDDIFVSLTNMINAFMVRDGRELDDDFFHLFSDFKSFARDLGFTDDDFDFIFRIHKIIHDHKQASVEFARDGKFVICLDGYNLEPITVEDVKAYIFKAQPLLKRLES